MHIPCSSVFPLEIYGMIIRECNNPRPTGALYFDDWRRRVVGTLSRCSLTCWGWHQYAQPYLFNTIYAQTNDWCYRSICKLAVIVREKPELGRLVKSLYIDGREGDPSWIAVTLHGRWFPDLVALTVLSGAG
ncbi:hypothetical protein K474DRAFT_480616 [Panus rudis PR-1116 ss-1]|nr:hypothetical protein K474DRAFT_480616 [Panus rudis PR-1116 ss-1]